MDGILPYHFVILTVTQFDGIPLSDTFKVLQYFTFAPSSSDTRVTGGSSTTGSHCHCVVRVGARVHFVKPTIMKSRVTSGVEEELSVLTRKWITFSEKMILQKSKDDPSRLTCHHGLGTAENEGVLDSSHRSTDNSSTVLSHTTAAEGTTGDRTPHTASHIHTGATTPTETRTALSYLQIIILLFLILVIILQYFYYSDLQMRLLRLEDQLANLLPQLTTTTTSTTTTDFVTAHQLDVTSNIALLTEELKKLSIYLYSTKNNEL